MSKNDTINIGKIILEKNPVTGKHVPQHATKFIDHGGILKTLAIGIRDNMPVIMIGETGTGKTSAVRHLAALTNNGLRRINLNGGTTADELVGRLLINEKGTYWVDGILTEAMRNGEWVLLDELNAALPEVLFVLQSIMDDDGYLVLNEKDDKEIVKKHANFRLFAGINPPSYAGTKELNRALLSRFPIAISAEYPAKSIETAIIKYHLGETVANNPLTESVISLSEDTRKSYKDGKADYAIGTRDVLNILRLSKYLSPMDALFAAFSGKLNNEEQNALSAIARLHLPSAKPTTNPKIQHVSSIDQANMIGHTYTLNADVHDAYTSILNNSAGHEHTLSQKSLTAIITDAGSLSHAIKGDTFQVKAIYYANQTGATNITQKGEKSGALIKFTKGTHKDKLGILLLEGNKEIAKNLYEVT